MRVLNDREEKIEEPQVDFSKVFLHSLLASLGFGTIFLSPLPVLLASLKLPEPWPKAIAVFGAVLSILVFKLPITFILPCFIVSIVVAHCVQQRIHFYPTVFLSVLSFLLTVPVLFFILWSEFRLGPKELWIKLTQLFTEQITVFFNKQLTPEFQQNLGYQVLTEGGGMIIAFVMLSTIVCIALASHLKWFEEGHPLERNVLRAQPLRKDLPWAYLLLWILAFSLPQTWKWLPHNGLRLVEPLLWFQGCITLSRIFEMWKVRALVRTLVYTLFCTIGYLGVVYLGITSPWILWRRPK